jgi:hypothetical protein
MKTSPAMPLHPSTNVSNALHAAYCPNWIPASRSCVLIDHAVVTCD